MGVKFQQLYSLCIRPVYVLDERLDGSTGIIFLTMKTQTFSAKGFIIERAE